MRRAGLPFLCPLPQRKYAVKAARGLYGGMGKGVPPAAADDRRTSIRCLNS